jgi:hypothetical protein
MTSPTHQLAARRQLVVPIPSGAEVLPRLELIHSEAEARLQLVLIHSGAEAHLRLVLIHSEVGAHLRRVVLTHSVVIRSEVNPAIGG